jgi:anti-sigma factor RsiW
MDNSNRDDKIRAFLTQAPEAPAADTFEERRIWNAIQNQSTSPQELPSHGLHSSRFARWGNLGASAAGIVLAIGIAIQSPSFQSGKVSASNEGATLPEFWIEGWTELVSEDSASDDPIERTIAFFDGI